MVTDTDVRLAVINAVLADVATKRDLEALRAELRADIERVKDSLKSLIERIARFEGQMNLFVKLFIAFNLPTLIAVIGILLRLVFT